MANLPSLIVPVGANIAGFTTAMGTVSQQLSKIDRDAAKAFAGFDKIGERLAGIGTSLTAALTAPLAGVGLAASKMAADFELGMRKVTSLLGDATETEFKNLSKATLELSKNMGVDAVGATNALYEAISAGIPKENAIEFMAVASKAAIAGVTDTKVAVDGLTNIMNAFGIQTSKAGEVADAMFQAVNIGKFTFEQLSQSVGIASGTASKLGVSFQELLSAAATITKQGFSVSEAMTSIQSAMVGIITPNKQMNELFAQMGVNSGEALLRTRGLEGALQDLQKATGGSNQQLAEALGRVEALRAALALTGKNVQGATQDFDAIAKSAGATQRAFEEIDKSTSRQFDRLTAEIKATAIELGQTLLPTVNSALAAFGDFVNDSVVPAVKWFAQLSDPVKNTVIGLTAFAVAIGPVVAGLGLLISAASSVGTGITTIAALFTALGASSIPAASAALATFATVTVPAAISALATFGATTLPNAILQIGFLSEVMLRQAVTSVATFATVTIPAAISALVTFATTAMPAAIVSVTTFATTTIPAAIASLVTFTTVSIPAAISGLVSFATAGVGSAISSLGTMASSALPAVIGVLSAMGVAATLAAGAFAGWKLGEWAYEQVPGMKTLGDSISGILLMIPGVEAGILRLTGASKMQSQASADLDFATQKLEASLRAKGVTVDRTGKTTEQYAAALREAAKNVGQVTPATDAATKATAGFAQTTIATAAEIKKQAEELKELASAHKFAMEHARKFNDELLLERYHMAAEAHRKLGKEIITLQDNLAKGKVGQTEFNDSLDQLVRTMGAAATGARDLSTIKMPDWMKANADQGIKEAADQMERLGKISAELGKHNMDVFWEGTKQKAKETSEALRQVSTIITDLSRNIAGGIFDLFKPSKKNEQLDQQRAELQRSLVDREADWEKYQAEVAAKLENLTAKNAEELAKQEDDVRKSLAAQQADYERDIAAIEQKISDLHERTATQIANDTARVMEGQRDQEEAYGGFVDSVTEKLGELPGKYQEQLDKELSSLKSSLDDHMVQWDRYVEDVNQSLSRVGEDLAERLDDLSRTHIRSTQDENKDFGRDVEDINKRIADENKDFGRDVQDINKDIAAAAKKGDKQREKELRESLKRRTEDHLLELKQYEEQLRRREEDHRSTLQRMTEDNVEAVDDAKKQAERQTTDLQEQLKERTEDHVKFLADNLTRAEEARTKAREGLEAERKDLEESLAKRTAALEKYREEAAAKIAQFTADHLAEQAKQERDLRDSMAERTWQWEGYRRDANDKLIDLRNQAADRLREQKDDLIASLNEHRTEWDKYKSDVNTKLDQLARDYETWTGRLKTAMGNALGSMGEAITRFGLEFFTGKLFKWIGDLVVDLIPSIGTALAKVLPGVFGGAASAAGSAAGSAASGGSSLASALASSGIMGTIGAVGSAISAVSGIIGNFQMRGMNQTLDLIEESTRYTAIATIGPAGVIDTMRKYLPWLETFVTDAWYGSYMPAFGSLMATTEGMRDDIRNKLIVATESIDQTLKEIHAAIVSPSAAASERLQPGLRPIVIYNMLDGRQVSRSVIENIEFEGVTA